ncbi:MAG: molybdenum cofactor guanylyltransferase [Planctomycetes bacterium]|nr:molybdenum cofactor guanylyltransferase [Planctomycetota bacterium]
MVDPQRVGGVVLCGGQSERMGMSKAWLDYGGEHFLTRIVKTIGQVVTPIVVAARSGQDLPSLNDDVRVVYDSVSRGGPLVGLLAAFDVLADKCDAVFVCACDQPLITPQFVKKFVDLLEDNKAILIEHDGRLHPLTAVYRLSARPLLAEMVAGEELRAKDFAARCGALTLRSSIFSEVDPKLMSLWNINDRQAYERLRLHLGL